MSKRSKRKKITTKNSRKKLQRALRTNLDKLTSKQIANYEDSLEVKTKMLDGTSLTKVAKQVGISPSTVKQYLGSALTLQNHRWIAKSSDRLLRKIRIYEKGKQIWITVRGRKHATLIGQYHSAIGRLTKDQSALKPFRKIKIKDVNGKIHHLETDSARIFEILEQQEDAEFYSIYARR